MAVAFGHDGDEEGAGRNGAGVDAGAVDGHVGSDQHAVEVCCEFSCGESHASASVGDCIASSDA
jgi:hypothetical protein